MAPQTKPPFLIGGIADLLRWVELLIFTISAPVLSVATVIAVVDLLTGGRLLASEPNLVFAFGVALAIGIDSQLPAAMERVRDAWESKRYLTLLLWALIGAWTGLVIFTALRAFSIEQAQHVDETTALAMIGFAPELFATQRDLLAVVLLGLSGFARVKVRAISRAEEREHLQREIELEPLRQQVEQLKARRVVNVVATGRAAVDAMRAPGGEVSLEENFRPGTETPHASRDASTQPSDTPDRPPTGPGGPATAKPAKTTRTQRPAVLRLEAPERPRRRAAARAQTPQQKRRATLNGRRVRTGADATASYEQEAKDAWANGATTINRMMQATGMSRAAASKWVRTLKGGLNPSSSSGQMAQ